MGRADANDIKADQARVTDSELLAQEGWKNAVLAFVTLHHIFGTFISRQP